VVDAAWALLRELRGACHALISGLSALSRFKELPLAPEMVVIPPGRFLMGSPPDGPNLYNEESPQHEVTIPHRFAVGRYAVTFEEWDAAFAAGGVKHNPKDGGWGRGRRPVINVSWDDAQAYVKWLSEKPRSHYRLLSEAEWEYVCRSGTNTPYWFGDYIREDQANSGEKTIEGGEKTTEVGSYPPNDFGVLDMHGNVLEWCEDRWHNNYEAKPDDPKMTGGAWVTGNDTRRVLRGGAWNITPQFTRSTARDKNDAGYRYREVGFRIARTITP